MNYQAIKAIYIFEMSRMRRTLFQSIVAPVISTTLYFVVFGAAIGSRITEIDGDKVREVKNLFVELTGLPFGSEVGQPCLHAAKFGMRAGTLAEEIKQKGHEGLNEMDMEWNQMIP